MTQGHHMICYADDRDVRYSVMTNHIKNWTLIYENNTIIILNLKKKVKVLLSVFLNTYLVYYLQSNTTTLGYMYKDW